MMTPSGPERSLEILSLDQAIQTTEEENKGCLLNRMDRKKGGFSKENINHVLLNS